MAKLIDEKFALEITGAAETHNEWLAIMRFGMDTLIKDQPLLFEIVIRRAHMEAVSPAPSSRPPLLVADHVVGALRGIFDELGLKLVVGGHREG